MDPMREFINNHDKHVRYLYNTFTQVRYLYNTLHRFLYSTQVGKVRFSKNGTCTIITHVPVQYTSR